MEGPMVLLASAFDQSRYLRAEELKQEKTLRIKNVTLETVNDRTGQVKKLVVWFTNIDKGLMLNKTNNRTIRSQYSDDVAGWAGKLIVLFPTQTDLGGRSVPALRVRIPPPKQAPGNGQTAKPQAAPVHPTQLERGGAGDSPPRTQRRDVPQPESDPEVDDFDGEISW
jgi:hypothetical protein